MRFLPALGLSVLLTIPLSAATFTVNSNLDTPDATPGDGFCATAGAVCTLRAAIQEANALAGTDTIAFTGFSGTITPASNLPSVTSPVVIDGTTSTLYAPFFPTVILQGGAANIGLSIAAGADGSTLRGLQFTGFSSNGVSISANSVIVQNNVFGPTNGNGLEVFGSLNRIGGNDLEGNRMSGNTGWGMLVGGSDHEISDNFIGVDDGALAAVPNGTGGILVFAGATGVTVGGFSPNAQNIISGNNGPGVRFSVVSDNRIASNYIGTDLNASTEIPNTGPGVHITGNSNNNEVGNLDAFTVISGNNGEGVLIDGGTGNVVQNSYIGVNAAGTSPLRNLVGVRILTSGNTVGHVDAQNVISGNDTDGIELGTGATGTTIINNVIGLNAAASAAISNLGYGIELLAGANNTVIGAIGAFNVISGNNEAAIHADSVSGLQVIGNVIGLAGDGATAIGNGSSGINLLTVTSSTIGGAGDAGNLISANAVNGIFSTGSSGLTIEGNLVGTDSSGTLDRGNAGNGILFINTVNSAITSNVISGNDQAGIAMHGTSSGNTITGNTIGLTLGLSTGLPNTNEGVRIFDATNNTIGGSDANRNWISANGGAGVSVLGTASGNLVTHNSMVVNGGLGIDLADLAADGVTANDPLDTDAGGNGLQNYPVITSAVRGGGTTQVSGTFSGAPSTTFTLHFYRSAAADPSGYGEGETFVGSTVITTDALGGATFNLTFPVELTGVITATATSPANSTSEFSGAVTVLAVPTVDFSSPTYSVNEDAGTITITINRSGDTSAASTVDYATSDGTATAGSDYTTTSGTATFAPGATSATFNIPIIDDASDEANETVTLTLSNPTNAVIGSPNATLTINDNDPTPTVTIDDVTLAEGNAGTTSFTFTISLSAVSGLPVTVDYASADGTATAGTDYTTVSGTATIPAGSTSTTVTVLVNGDTVPEGAESLVINLTNPTNASVTDAQGLGTITNDDAPALTIGDVSQAEGNAATSNFIFMVTLSSPAVTPVTVDYATADGTATAGSDYTSTNGTVTIPTGSTTATITVVVSGDTASEPDETFFVNLTNPTGATIADSQATGTITNDDALPVITISDVTQAEGNAGTTNFVFTVTLASPAATPVTVDYATADGTATAGSDYTAATGTLTIPAGATTGTVTVVVNGDTAAEANETFVVNLTNATGATVLDAQATGTITNDDAAAAAADVPTASEWGLLALAAALALFAVARMR